MDDGPVIEAVKTIPPLKLVKVNMKTDNFQIIEVGSLVGPGNYYAFFASFLIIEGNYSINYLLRKSLSHFYFLCKF